jgi:hypothetical protein
LGRPRRVRVTPLPAFLGVWSRVAAQERQAPRYNDANPRPRVLHGAGFKPGMYSPLMETLPGPRADQSDMECEPGDSRWVTQRHGHRAQSVNGCAPYWGMAPCLGTHACAENRTPEHPARNADDRSDSGKTAPFAGTAIGGHARQTGGASARGGTRERRRDRTVGTLVLVRSRLVRQGPASQQDTPCSAHSSR